MLQRIRGSSRVGQGGKAVRQGFLLFREQFQAVCLRLRRGQRIDQFLEAVEFETAAIEKPRGQGGVIA